MNHDLEIAVDVLVFPVHHWTDARGSNWGCGLVEVRVEEGAGGPISIPVLLNEHDEITAPPPPQD